MPGFRSGLTFQGGPVAVRRDRGIPGYVGSVGLQGSTRGRACHLPVRCRAERQDSVQGVRSARLRQAAEGGCDIEVGPASKLRRVRVHHRSAGTEVLLGEEFADVERALCVATGTTDVHPALIAARHHLPGTGTLDDSVLASS
ncbi:DUF5133 domain-containing protein [Streptomyces vinaceus]|uniref:DUF5133 domain-containing protein n=1 Tax=Streptomyces vinaceus TaxID=1960 RepID=UPI0035DE0DC9